MSGNEEAAPPSDPDWVRGTLSCVADCGTIALIAILKAIFFAILPLITLFLALALPVLGRIPADNLAALGVLLLVIYQLIFLVIFVLQQNSPASWSSSVDVVAALQKHRYSILVHGTDEAHPIHLRVCRDTPLISIGIYLWRRGCIPSDFISTMYASTCKSFFLHKMNWSDTVGDHGLGTLSSITLSVSLLGGASGSGDGIYQFFKSPNSKPRLTSIPAGPSTRPECGKDTNYHAALDEGAAEPEPVRRKHRRVLSKAGDADMSADDEVYDPSEHSGYEGDQSDDSDMEMVIDGEELASTLTAKTDPKSGKRRSQNTGAVKGKGKATAKPARKKSRKSDPPLTSHDNPEPDTVPEEARKPRKPTKSAKTHPIWCFFKQLDAVDVDNAEADKNYFKCNLGNRAVIALTKTVNGNFVPLKNHLKIKFPQHFRMFLVWVGDESRPMTPEVAKKFQNDMAKIEGNIITAMKKRAENAKEPWDQSHFENLLAKWIAATDQPFSVVEELEFKALLQYVHYHSSRILALPNADTIRRKIMAMGKDVEEKLTEMFAVKSPCAILSCANIKLKENESTFSVLLDAWTSSNGYAFIAIVLHWIDNKGQLRWSTILSIYIRENLPRNFYRKFLLPQNFLEFFEIFRNFGQQCKNDWYIFQTLKYCFYIFAKLSIGFLPQVQLPQVSPAVQKCFELDLNFESKNVKSMLHRGPKRVMMMMFSFWLLVAFAEVVGPR
ncbi:hypothetical protein DFH07DRAFT_780342 [Mycena maculata]|uniref:Uncharacterized protein n=1 Tax=Mycena maculata TaxID=230809 RepID=A0AAD7MVR1_9AGAR|nr:hypothetical protein DFH07DRAFT_780342 [Mycena maculata]